MWSLSSLTNKTQPQRRRHHHGTMARRRQLISSRMVRTIIGGVLLVTVLVSMVYLSNQVVTLRSSIANLEYQCEFVEAQAAHLQARWNRETRPEVIIARAERKLGLVQPLMPTPVLVKADPGRDLDRHWWQVFDGLSGTDQAWADEPVNIAVRETRPHE